MAQSMLLFFVIDLIKDLEDINQNVYEETKENQVNEDRSPRYDVRSVTLLEYIFAGSLSRGVGPVGRLPIRSTFL